MLSEITEVKELLFTQDVNTHIKQGWKLLDTYKATGIHEKQVIKYCVGWPKSAGQINLQKSASEQTTPSKRNSFIYSL